MIPHAGEPPSVRGEPKGRGVQQARAEQHDAQQDAPKGLLVEPLRKGVPYDQPDVGSADGDGVQRQVGDAAGAHEEVGQELDAEHAGDRGAAAYHLLRRHRSHMCL